jgi:hypothetical protein
VASAVVVDWLAEDELPAWEALVAASPTGSAYSLPGYLEALAAAAGGRFRVLAARRGDALAGGIAVYERPTRLGRVVRPRLLLYYNGLVLPEQATRYPSERTSREARTVDALAAALEALGLRRVELRTRPAFADARPFLERGWSAAPSYTYVVPLTDLEAQWELVEQNLRRLVRRCERDGFELADGSFDDLFRLHAGTHERKRAPLYLPEERFRAYHDSLVERGLARVYAARSPAGRVVAAQLVLLGHPVTHTVAAGTEPDAARTGATAFLRWKAFESLAAAGSVANDLTDAMLGPVAHFKAQLGARLEQSLVVERATAADRAIGRSRDAARRIAGRS